jgi:hypothetical protein
LYRHAVWEQVTDVSEVFSTSIVREIALMEAASTSETSVKYQTIRRYNPEDGIVETVFLPGVEFV